MKNFPWLNEYSNPNEMEKLQNSWIGNLFEVKIKTDPLQYDYEGNENYFPDKIK